MGREGGGAGVNEGGGTVGVGYPFGPTTDVSSESLAGFHSEVLAVCRYFFGTASGFVAACW